MKTKKPTIGKVITDDEMNKWIVTDNIHSEKFLWQTPSLIEKIKGIFGGKTDFWIPVKRLK